VRARAVIEVVLVFALTLLLIVVVTLSPVGAWERRITHHPFLEYLVMAGLPLIILLITRRHLPSYGLSLRPARYHLDVAATAIVPVALTSAALGLVDYTQWSGALIISALKAAALVAVARLLRDKPAHGEEGIALGVALLVNGAYRSGGLTATRALSAFAFYFLFLALGEEILFRGYIQSRLNEAWGRPFRFYGVPWGWGLVIASLLFGFMHVLNLGSLVQGHWQPEWWWGLWTFFSGLVLGFVREKTGSIAASSLLHGLPQALAVSIGLLLGGAP
jgi:hypothetical protein